MGLMFHPEVVSLGIRSSLLKDLANVGLDHGGLLGIVHPVPCLCTTEEYMWTLGTSDDVSWRPSSILDMKAIAGFT